MAGPSKKTLEVVELFKRKEQLREELEQVREELNKGVKTLYKSRGTGKLRGVPYTITRGSGSKVDWKGLCHGLLKPDAIARVRKDYTTLPAPKYYLKSLDPCK